MADARSDATSLGVDGIQAFVKAARLGDFGRAASALRRPESTLVRRIGFMEEDLGAALFERTRRGVSLTEAGRALLPYAESALLALQEGSDAVRALRDHRIPLTVALVGSLARAKLTRVFQDLRRRHPIIKLSVRIASSGEVSRMVDSGMATLGVRYHPDPTGNLVSRVLSEESFIAVASPRHRLARRKNVPQWALAQERWVTFLGARGSREIFIHNITKAMTAAGLGGAEIIPVVSQSAQKRLVEAGYGLALMPRGCVQQELRVGTLVELELPLLRMQIPICAVHKRGRDLPQAAYRLMDQLEQVLVAAQSDDGANASSDLPVPASGN